MIDILIQKPFTSSFSAGVLGEHNFRQLKIELPTELQGADSYILEFEQNGKAVVSDELSEIEGYVYYPIGQDVSTLSDKYVNATLTGYFGDNIGKSLKFSLRFENAVNVDGAEIIDGVEKGIVEQAFEIADKFDETEDGQPTYNGEPITADTSNFLAKDNIEEYTPTADYHPATKKYVDDNAGGSAGGGEGMVVVETYADLPETGTVALVKNTAEIPQITHNISFDNPDYEENARLYYRNFRIKSEFIKPTFEVFEDEGLDAFLYNDNIRYEIGMIFVIFGGVTLLYIPFSSPETGIDVTYIYAFETVDFGGGMTLTQGWNREVVPEEQYEPLTFAETGLDKLFTAEITDMRFDTPESRAIFETYFEQSETEVKTNGLYTYNGEWSPVSIGEPLIVEDFEATNAMITPNDFTIYRFGALDTLTISLPPTQEHYEFWVEFKTKLNGHYNTELSLSGALRWDNGEVPNMNSTYQRNAVLCVKNGIAKIMLQGEADLDIDEVTV